ncbi:MAG: tetratricopeptide repeat protein [Gammaproteobacteria bacterium WSBS_2016_MAG_OTU1]
MRTLSTPLSAAKRLLSFLTIIALMTGQVTAFAQEKEDCGDICEELETGIIASREQRAVIYLEKEEWDKLGEIAQRWTNDYPGEAKAWNYLGLSQQGAGKAKEAIDSFFRAWQLTGQKDFRIIESIGDSYSEIKEWNKAKTAYETTIELRPDYPILWRKLASTMENISATHELSTNVEGVFDENTIKARKKLIEEVIRIYKKTLTFRDYYDEYNLWEKYILLLEVIDGDIDEKYLVYRNITRIKKTNISAWERLYEIETTRDNLDEVRKIADILFRIDSKNPLANLLYGKLALENNLHKKAREYFEIGINHNSVSPKQRANIYISLGDLETQPQRALPYYRDAAISDPANTAAWEHVIVMLRGLNRRADAEKIFHGLRAVEFKLKKKITPTKEDAQPLLALQ